mmetsp:Transcript_37017/g.85443  ORF Transcript_37017/g.85443 Transcript_37017/m.85443 type:complete len:167 (-) Transcript_37017:192-692(-)|eukprot:3701767-Amphidinium_carterae.2
MAHPPNFLVATIDIPRDIEAELQVEITGTGFQGIVLKLRQPADAAKLEMLKPLLSKLPWDKPSIKLGDTLEEMGNPKQTPLMSDTNVTKVCWQDKSLVVQGHDGGPGVGKETSLLWQQVADIIEPLYDYGPKLEMDAPKLEMTPPQAELVLEKPPQVAETVTKQAS